MDGISSGMLKIPRQSSKITPSQLLYVIDSNCTLRHEKIHGSCRLTDNVNLKYKVVRSGFIFFGETRNRSFISIDGAHLVDVSQMSIFEVREEKSGLFLAKSIPSRPLYDLLLDHNCFPFML